MYDTFHYNLSLTYSHFSRRAFSEMSKVCPELTPGQPKIIDYLMCRKEVNQKEIALDCGISPPTLSNILTRMELLGLVERKKDASNRRSFLVCLTSQGHEYGKKIQVILSKMEEVAMDSFSQEQRSVLIASLKRIQKIL